MYKLISGIILSIGLSVAAVADESSPMPSVSVEFCGRLRHGVVAMGGESTGTTISVGRMIWEVQLLSDSDRKFAETYHKETVVVTGTLRKVAGVETKDRWVIDARKMSVQDASKDHPGVKITIVGLLRAAAPDPAGTSVAWMAIQSADQVWPIDRPTDASVTMAAETLLGQSVLLAGSVKPDPEYVPGATPMIQVTSVKRSQQTPGPR